MDEQEISKRLREPFPVSWVQWRPGPTSRDGKRAMAIAYIDARAVMVRLDQVVGPLGWSDTYRVLQVGGDQVVECSLTLYSAGVSVTKADVGELSPADRGGISPAKSGYSDAFKRAAVKWGIGRYLYSLPDQWVDLDQNKRIVGTPKLPSWAIPAQETEDSNIPPPTGEGQQGAEQATSPQTQQDPAEHFTTVVPFGKYKNQTIGQIYATDPSYVEWLASKSNNETVREAAKAFLTAWLDEKAKDEEDEPPGPATGEHWSKDKARQGMYFQFEKRFYQDHQEALQVLGVAHLEEFEGTMGDAFTLLAAGAGVKVAG